MIENNKILIVDPMHESILPLLSEAGFDANYQPQMTRRELLSIIENYCGLILRNKTNIDAELIDKGTRLRFVARAGAGIDQMDVEYLKSKNIAIVNAPEGNRDALGEHALGMLLNLTHKINVADNEVKHGIWNRESNRGFELKDKTVGIYGFGYMGQALAEKLDSLGCRIIAYDKFKRNFSNQYVKEVNLADFKAQTEILSLHIPLTKETQFLFNYDTLRQYPKLKIIINTARGKILKLEDSIRLMEEGKLFGLGLDVLENEPISPYVKKALFKRLTNLQNVILTPHVAGWTHESYLKINKVLVSKISNLSLHEHHPEIKEYSTP